MTAALIILGIAIAVTVMIWVKALFGTPADLTKTTEFDRAWFKLLDGWDSYRTHRTIKYSK